MHSMLARAAFAFGLLVTTSAMADFNLDTHVTVNPAEVLATACNNVANEPIDCQVTAFGQYPNGYYVDSWAHYILAPGECEYAKVASGYPEYYFVDGDGQAVCRFLP